MRCDQQGTLMGTAQREEQDDDLRERERRGGGGLRKRCVGWGGSILSTPFEVTGS